MLWPNLFPTPAAKTPRWRFFGFAAKLAFGLACGGLFSACDRIEIERRFYANGQLAEERAMLVLPDGRHLPHGLQVRWRPDGSRLSLEIRRHGLRQGYALEWNAAGELQSRVNFEKGAAMAEFQGGGVDAAPLSPPIRLSRTP